MESQFEFNSDKTVEIAAPKKSRPFWQKIVFFAIIIGIIAAIIFGLTTLLGKDSDNSSKTKKTDSKTPATATESAKANSERCKPKQDLNNTKQGYQACFEAGWSQKELKVNGLEIGLSDKEISSGFPGTINIAITNTSEDLVAQNQSNNSSKFEFGKTNVDGKKSTQLVITRSRDDPLIAYPRAIMTATTANGRTYVFTLNSTDATFEADMVIYETFLTTIEFLDDVAKTPWSDSRNILVDQPWADDSISSPVTISGQALSFEAVVNIRIKDKDGRILTETTVKSASGTERSAFSGNISFDKPKTTTGTIEIYNTSTADGSDQDKVTIPVKFQ